MIRYLYSFYRYRYSNELLIDYLKMIFVDIWFYVYYWDRYFYREFL